MGEGSIPKSINFDQYQRYHFIERVIDAFAGGQQLKVLEVGGAFSSALQHLSEKHQICIADSIEAPDIQLRAKGDHLPFAEKSFDIVVCTDVLEHLPSEQRRPLIQELQRVTSGILILGFPNNTPEAKAADQILSDWIREMRGNDYAFLSEHTKYGLPDAEDIKRILQERTGQILEAINANVYSWLPLMMSYFAIENREEFESSKKILNELFNSNFDAASHTPPGYRIFYVWFAVPHSETKFHVVKSTLNPPEAPVHDFAFASLVLSLSFERALHRVKETSARHFQDATDLRANLQEVHKGYRAELESSQNRHRTELDAIHQDYRAQLEAVHDGYRNELKKSEDVSRTELEKVHNGYRSELEILRVSSGKLETHLNSLNREISQLQADRLDLINKLNNTNEELKERASWMKQQDEKIEELQNRISSLQGTLDRQRQVIDQREQSINRLEDELKQSHRIQHETVEAHEKQVFALKLQSQNDNREHELQIARIKSDLHHTTQYLNLFLNHPVYKMYKFFKPTRGLNRNLQPREAEPRHSVDQTVTDPSSLLQEADQHFLSGRVGQASSIYRDVINSNNRNERAITSLARLLQSKGEFIESQQILIDSLQRDPASIPILTLLAGSYLSTGSFWEAEKLYQRIHQLAPRNIDALIGLADLSMGNADYDTALNYYKRILEFEPKNITALSGLSECAKNRSAAAKDLPRFIKDFRNDSLVKAICQQPLEKPQTLTSIIIPVFNQLIYTRRCIEEIQRNTTLPYEIIVIDNGSTDGTLQYLSSVQNQRLKIKRNEKNDGFVDACNQGVELAAGEYLVFLNNDTLPRPGWLDALLDVIQNDSGVGAVGAKLLYPDGTLQEAGSIVFSNGTAWNFGKGDDPQKPEYCYLREASYCSAACLLITKDLFRKIGGFDSRYSPAYWEDADLAFEVRKHGFKVVYQPFAEIIHFEGATGGTDTASGYKQYQIRNQAIFNQKWSRELNSQPEFKKHKIKSASIQNSNPRILVVDHYLPVFDRNSGNHRAFQLMRLIQNAGYPSTFVARNGEYQQRYKQALERMGVETYATDVQHLHCAGYIPSVQPIHWDSFLEEGEYKIAILSRYQNAATYLPLIRIHSPETKIVLDTVDVHFLREERKANLYGTSDLHEQANQTRKAELEVCKQADALIAVTADDASVLRKEIGAEKPIWVIPNIHPVPESPAPFDERNGLLFVGNFVHPPNSDAVFYFCSQILPLIRTKLPDITLYIVGGNSLPLLQDLQNDDRIVITGYVPSTAPYLTHCRVSINPLRYGAGMKGKIGEAMAYGLPVVTTTIGAEGFNMQAGIHALVEDSPEEFANAVIMAYTVEALWKSLSVNGRKMISEIYSPEAVSPAVSQMLEWKIESDASQSAVGFKRYAKK